MTEPLSSANEDYLKAIYALSLGEERVSTNEIADHLGVAPASVTNMLKKLASTDPPLVEYRKHRGVVLTSEGQEAALEVIRHHRLIESFLHDTLGYSWDEVHEEAERLEHVISEELEERIASALGHPSHDPHGHPIPSRDFQLPEDRTQPLSDLRDGDAAIVRRVEGRGSAFLRHLAELGLVPGANVDVLDYSQFDETLRLKVGGRAEDIVVGPGVSEQVYVEV